MCALMQVIVVSSVFLVTMATQWRQAATHARVLERNPALSLLLPVKRWEEGS